MPQCNLRTALARFPDSFLCPSSHPDRMFSIVTVMLRTLRNDPASATQVRLAHTDTGPEQQPGAHTPSKLKFEPGTGVHGNVNHQE